MCTDVPQTSGATCRSSSTSHVDHKPQTLSWKRINAAVIVTLIAFVRLFPRPMSLICFNGILMFHNMLLYSAIPLIENYKLDCTFLHTMMLVMWDLESCGPPVCVFVCVCIKSIFQCWLSPSESWQYWNAANLQLNPVRLMVPSFWCMLHLPVVCH